MQKLSYSLVSFEFGPFETLFIRMCQKNTKRSRFLKAPQQNKRKGRGYCLSVEIKLGSFH